MMKVIIMMISMMLMINLMNYYLVQMIYQNLLFLMTFMFLIMFPLNSFNFWLKIYYNLTCDFYSFSLILLSLWILNMMMMMSLNYLIYKWKNYILIWFIMMLMLILCFLSINMMLFYLYFESSLLPIFFLVMGWGFQMERVQASFYMMLYTLFGSMPLFYMIMNIYVLKYTLMFNFIEIKDMNFFMYLMIMMAFFIKMPMYFLHLWLPKAHVEAPLGGSMILAGVMLKLGSYGLLRFMMLMFDSCMKFNKYIIIISIMGGIYSSLICLCQLDMKMLVAYSSVVHMSLLMSGMMTLFNLGIFGGLIMMIAHGLCSSGLFCLVNMNYERTGSRSLLMNKGMINFIPSFSMMWFLMCSSNLSFPPSLNLFSEICLISSLIMWDKSLIILMMLLLFFSAMYSLYLYSFSQHGIYNNLIYYMKMIMLNEYLVLLLHWLPLNFMFIYMFIYM